MEVHQGVNSVVAKRLWNVLRVTFFTIRKGLLSKTKLIVDMNLMMKRGKLLRKSLSNLMAHHVHHHQHSHRSVARGGLGIQEYEFSCSNSPDPVFFRVPKRKHCYFPCINLPEVMEEEEEELEQEPKALVLVPKPPEYTFNLNCDASDFGSGAFLSPFSVRVSNYSSEDESDINGGNSGQVDDAAEEFIRRFYEQLRIQSRMQVLQYN